MEHFNGLSPAELERLAILSEELGEAQQAVGKILRHGYASLNPLKPKRNTNNRMDLERELGDVLFAIRLLGAAGDVDPGSVDAASVDKFEKSKPYLHHQ